MLNIENQKRQKTESVGFDNVRTSTITENISENAVNNIPYPADYQANDNDA